MAYQMSVSAPGFVARATRINRCASTRPAGSRVSQVSAYKDSGQLLCRDDEQQQLKDIVDGPPMSLTVVLGPGSSGKTLLVKKTFLHDYPALQSSQHSFVPGPCDSARHVGNQQPDDGWSEAALTSNGQPVLYLDMRHPLLGDPEGFAAGIIKGVTSLVPSIRSPPESQAAPDARRRQTPPKLVSALRMVGDLAATSAAQCKPAPIVVVDASDKLGLWRPEVLQTLLDALVRLAKQEDTKGCHVFLVTHSTEFLNLLMTFTDADNLQIYFVDDFDYETAKKFVLLILQEDETDLRTSFMQQFDDVWLVVGGNPRNLKRTVDRMRRRNAPETWKEAALGVACAKLLTLYRFTGATEEEYGLTGKHVEYVILRLAETNGAIPYKDLRAELEAMGGDVRDMVRAGFLRLRSAAVESGSSLLVPESATMYYHMREYAKTIKSPLRSLRLFLGRKLLRTI